MVRVEVKFIGSDRIGRYIATGKIGIGISVKWHIGATLVNRKPQLMPMVTGSCYIHASTDRQMSAVNTVLDM